VLLPLLLATTLTAAEPQDIQLDYLPPQAWAVGTQLFVAGHKVNLRAAASAEAPVVTELELGTPVTIKALLADDVEVAGRRGRWYAVEIQGTGQQGALFGGVLTPARIEADLDQDGVVEVAVLTWGWDYHKVIRIHEPGLEGPAAVAQLDLGQSNDIDGPMEQMWAGITTAADTGIPMLKLHTPGREMCGSGSATHYVSYLSPDKASKGVLREAIREHHWSDAPVYDHIELSFEPAAMAVTARHTSYNGEDDEQITVTRHVLKDGVFEAEAPTGTHPN